MESAVMYKHNEQNNSLISINFKLEGISKQKIFRYIKYQHFCHCHFEINEFIIRVQDASNI